MTGTAFVTGGTGALGVAVTNHLLSIGWRVVVPFIEPSEASRLDDHERLELVRANVSVPNELSAAVALAAGDSDAPLTALVNLVGGFESGPRTHEADAEAIDRQLDLNVKTTYAVLREGLPHLVAHGGGSVDTPANRAAMPNSDRANWVAPADIAKVIAFLLSDDSAPISGAAIPLGL